jgi:hypothetical protein
VSLTDGSAGPHEWIENDLACEVMAAIELLLQVCAARQLASQEDTAKNGAQAFCPPLVNVIYGPIDFLPPALGLGEVGEEIKSKRVRLNEKACFLLSFLL